MSSAAALPDPLARRIAAFLERIGIAVAVGRLDEETFLPGIRVSAGGLIVDPERLKWPTDLLHEAGHIALTDPAERASLDRVSDDPGEEMGAIAWSYAAAVALGIEATTLFHEEYRGGGEALARTFASGQDVGVPMLAWHGLCAQPHRSDPAGPTPYPHMLRWLR